MSMQIRIERADSVSKYEGLRDLWCRVFGDEPEYVDSVYDIFAEDITGYVILNDDGKVVSALSCYRYGDLGGVPVYVSYAVCTDPEYRGLGLAGRLTDYVRNVVTAPSGAKLHSADAPDAAGMGGISVVSPAEESLIRFYEGLGYGRTCYAEEITVPADDGDGEDMIMGEDDDFEVFTPALSVTHADTEEYNLYREAFLADVPHAALSQKMLRLVRAESRDGDSLLVINGGDAICVLTGTGTDGTLTAAELIVNPALRAFSEEIDTEIAAGLAEQYGNGRIIFRRPAADTASPAYLQSMASGNTDEPEFYFGFPVE